MKQIENLKKLRNLISQKTLVKFTITYLLVLIIPLFGLTFISDRIVFKELSDQLLDKHQTSVQHSLEEINKEIISYNILSEQIKTYAAFSAENLNKSLVASKDVASILKTLKSTLSTVDDIYYYNTGANHYLYTSGGTYSGKYIPKYLLNDESLDVTEFFAQHTSPSWYIPAGFDSSVAVNNYLYYIVQIVIIMMDIYFSKFLPNHLLNFLMILLVTYILLIIIR